jgi:hypothetical protein
VVDPTRAAHRHLSRHASTSATSKKRPIGPLLSLHWSERTFWFASIGIMPKTLKPGAYGPLPTFFDDNQEIDYHSYGKHLLSKVGNEI